MNARANHIVLHSLFSRELAHGIPAQTIDRFSQVRSTECKALFCFYISSVFACLMYEIIRLDVVCEIHANFALYITRLARKVLWARFLKRRFHPVIHHADRVPPLRRLCLIKLLLMSFALVEHRYRISFSRAENSGESLKTNSSLEIRFGPAASVQ